MRASARFRLLPVALGAWAVALWAIFAPAWAPVLAGGLWIVALGVLAVVVRAVGARRMVAVAVLALVAAAAAASHVALAQPARLEAAALALDGGRAVEIRATVVGKVERRADGSLAFDAQTHAVVVGTRTIDISVPIAVRVDPAEAEAGLEMGAVIVASGSVSPGYPGEREVLTVRATRGVAVQEAASGVLAVTAALRKGLVTSASTLPGPGAGLIPGLAVGDTWAVTPELDAAMKESSLSHLTAVSGANCVLVVGIAFASAMALGGGRRTRIVVAVAALSGFVLLVTPEPSVVRAGAMAAIAMLGLALGRVGAGIGILSLAVTALLVMDPWLAGSLGFALSAAATASLLLFARPLARGLERRLPRAPAVALSVPLAAQLACGPLLVLITPTVPLYGVVANLLAAPAAPLATVIGLAACLSAPFPSLQDGLTAIAWLPASWIAATADVMTSLPGDLLPWIEGWPGAIALALLGLAIGVVIAMRPGAEGRARRLRIAAGAVVAVVVGVLAGSTALGGFAGRWTLPSHWSVVACDVGQGDAVLLRSAGAFALIDTGPAPAPLAACLDRVGVARVDLLVLTHFDLDHAGGVEAVAGRVGTVLHGPTASPADAAVLAALQDGGAEVIDAHAGLGGTLGSARWRVLWPRAETRAFPSGNDASVVLEVRGGGIPPIVLLGDLSASPQRALAASGKLDGPYAIVKIAHHGSADQDPGLYELLDPAVALVTVGADNDYGHPRDDTLAIAEDLGAVIARTDREGLIALWLEGAEVRVWRDRGG